MLLPPQRSTLSYNLFPYTTLVRSRTLSEEDFADRRRFIRLNILHLRRGDHAPLPARHLVDARDARPQQEQDQTGGGGDHDLLAAAEALPKFDDSHDYRPAWGSGAAPCWLVRLSKRDGLCTGSGMFGTQPLVTSTRPPTSLSARRSEEHTS